MNFIAVAFGASICLLAGARGQGLLGIGPRFNDEVRLPFSFTVSSLMGWDSEPGAGSSTTNAARGASDGHGSAFWQNSLTLHLPVGQGRSRFEIDADYANTWNFNPPRGTQEFQNNGSLNGTYFRQINQRLSVGDDIHFSHQTEPNFQVGVSLNRPTSGQIYLSNNLWASYSWSTRFSTVSSYSASLISYDNDALESEDYSQHVLSEQIRYALTRKTTATLEYRFSFTDYPHNPDAESESHFILLGVNRPLGRFLAASLNAGTEFRSYDGPLGSLTSPYGEASIVYRARKNTTFRFYYRAGLEDTGRAGTQSSFSHRTGVAMSQQFGHGISANLAVDNINSSFTRGTAGQKDAGENTFHATAGLNYYRHLWRRLGFNASYTYSLVSSDDDLSDYSRHRISMGISASF